MSSENREVFIMSEKLVIAENVVKVYKSGTGGVRAVDGLSFDIDEGEFARYSRSQRLRQDHFVKFNGRHGQCDGRQSYRWRTEFKGT